MRPVTSLFPISSFALRLVPLLLVYVFGANDLKEFNFKDLDYLLWFATAVFSVLLIIGAFSSKHTLTVISALLLTISAALMIYFKPFVIVNIFYLLIFICIGLYFFSVGNKKPSFS